VPLPPLAVHVLESLRPLTGDKERVFDGVSESNAERDWWSEVRRCAMSAAASADGSEHFTRHDLRRTCATKCGELGAPPHVISRILGHATADGTTAITAVYNRYAYMAEKGLFCCFRGLELAV
jgi:integrase